MSNVIKSSHYVPVDDKIVIHPSFQNQHQASFGPSPGVGNDEVMHLEEAESASRETAAAIEAREHLIRDAEEYAEQVIRQAAEEAERMRAGARNDIELWWEQRRTEDERHAEEARVRGLQTGYEEGLREAEDQVRKQYESMFEEAQRIIQSSVAFKQQIIQESEPFLIGLSCSIAEKIINRQLTIEPQWSIDLIRGLLQRRKEQGVITLCVSPEQFMFVQDARDELMLAVDSQAELQIIPDPNVRDRGCVIRSSFGSIDARIDTQLEEIKKSLQQVAIRSEGGADDE